MASGSGSWPRPRCCPWPWSGCWYEREQVGLGVPCEPAPLSRPHPPILVGGGGEKKTLRLVARYADACNVFGTGVQDVGRKLEVLRSHCEAEGRDYDGIAKTVLAVAPLLADVDGFVAAAGDYAAIGVNEIAVMPDRHPVEFTEQLAERILPRVAGIG